MAIYRISFVYKFVLLRRIETITHCLIADDHARVHSIIENTISMIADRDGSDVHKNDLNVYVRHLEIAQLLLYINCKDAATRQIELAKEVIRVEYYRMIPTYIMCLRIAHYEQKLIGSLSSLPNDVLQDIRKIIEFRN